MTGALPDFLQSLQATVVVQAFEMGQGFFTFLICSTFIVIFPIYSMLYNRVSRDSSVGIALGYGLYDRASRVRFLAGLGSFLFTTASRTALAPTQPPIR
jgi:hypothetical protein